MIAYARTEATASASTWGGYNDTSTGTTWNARTDSWSDYLEQQQRQRELAELRKYEQNRNWMPAPEVIAPVLLIPIIRRAFTRRFTSRKWTGKNYHK